MSDNTEAGSNESEDTSAQVDAGLQAQTGLENEAEGSGVDSSALSNVAPSPDLDVILDIPVEIAMEVGSTSITIRNLLQLNQGSVIELDRLAGEPLDVLVNGTLIAHGEVVVVNDKFGIRMTDVISPSERIKRLN